MYTRNGEAINTKGSMSDKTCSLEIDFLPSELNHHEPIVAKEYGYIEKITAGTYLAKTFFKTANTVRIKSKCSLAQNYCNGLVVIFL